MVDKNLLKARCNGDTLISIAEVIGITPNALANKIKRNGQSDLKLDEMRKIVKHYKLTDKQIIELFFGGEE